MNNIQNKFYSLEQHFETICNHHPHLKLLESQWRFDQELISKALQNVSSVFPHYSRHDASHSRQIIVNIERMLGDKIQFLSATDTWLILEAAYNHDIGMVITQNQIEDMNTPEFSDFVDSLIADKESYLRKFAKKWKKNKATLPQKADAHGFFHQYIQLLAEWYRRKHSENSAKIVRNPMGEIGLNSSRNELLPNRLFNVLANICQAHGENFEHILKTLPKAEAGMASEDCHPLYVACLLRIADLLDIDDNRFCPVMMSMCGNDLPDSSKVHFDKHHSIRHFRLDSEQIEIECICPTPDSYEVAYDWFEWLKEEYNHQTQNWEKIVPFKELGRLPTLMKPSVKIDEPYLILQEGKKPSFQINEEAILKLVRGAGLYSSKFDSIREILQNATDATLHRIWLEKKEEILRLQPGNQELQDIYDKYKINVSFEPKKDNDKCWVLKVTDVGIGISFEDLQHMLEIGSSFKNKSKQSRLKDMPMWFRPSGAFGIGLQSAYLLANKFTIITRSIVDGQALEIKFNKKNQSVIIKKIKNDIAVGTQFIIEIKVKNMPERITLPFGHTKFSQVLSEYDFLSSDSNLSSLEVIKIKDYIEQFFSYSPIPLKGCDIDRSSKYFFDKEHNIALYNIEFGDFNGYFTRDTFFRGQSFKDLPIAYKGIRFSVDFYHTTSDKFLTYNREKILEGMGRDTIKKLNKVLKKYIEEQFDDLPTEQQPFASFCYVEHCHQGKYTENPIKILQSLNDLPITFESGKIMTIAEVLHAIEDKSLSNLTGYDQYYSKLLPKPLDNVVSNNIGHDLLDLIKFLVTKNDMYYIVTEKNPPSMEFSDKILQPFTSKIFKSIILQKKEQLGSLHNIGCRLVFPAWDKYRKLSINLDCVRWVDIEHYTAFNENYLVLPIDFRCNINDESFYENSDNLIDWVYEHRKDGNVTKAEINQLNLELIKHIKSVLSQNSEDADEKED